MDAMNIGIIDSDLLDNGTRHPNLALMKISGFYKAQGHSVKLLNNYTELSTYDIVFISRVFSYTKVPDSITDLPNVKIGGTGFYKDGGANLADEIEHHMPDYSLYNDYTEKELARGRNRGAVSDYLDFSIGFTTRGCFRKCPFCVNKKYTNAFKHSPVIEFYDETRPYIYLWDDNFLAYGGWESILDELEATGKPFQFRQGLDVRLMTDQKAKRLSKTRYHGDFIFAFDHLEDKDLIEEKLAIWRRYCSKTTKLYILCAYKSQDADDIADAFERIKILMKYGCLPYIMRYEKYDDSEWRTLYVQIARWCNQPHIFKRMSFREFCLANQDYHKNKNTICSALLAMDNFEAIHPDIARKYFDLRFDDEYKYSKDFGYGRKYANKQNCEICTAQQKSWEDAYTDLLTRDSALGLYFQKEMDLQCLSFPDISCVTYSKEVLADWFCQQLLNTSLTRVYEITKLYPLDEEVLPSNIPQFSNLEDVYLETPDVLIKSGKAMTYDELGTYLDNGQNKNEIAQRKYGENHSKLAALLDLAVITSQKNAYRVSVSVFGEAFNKLDSSSKKAITARLMFRIPIIQKMLIEATEIRINIDDELSSLSEQTKKRRKPNILSIIRFLHEATSEEEFHFRSILNNIEGWE